MMQMYANPASHLLDWKGIWCLQRSVGENGGGGNGDVPGTMFGQALFMMDICVTFAWNLGNLCGIFEAVWIQVSDLLSLGFHKFGRLQFVFLILRPFHICLARHGEVCWSLCLAALRALRQLMEVWIIWMGIPTSSWGEERSFIIIFQQLLLCSFVDVSENSGTPKSSILIGFSIINHPFWGTKIFGNTHVAHCFKYFSFFFAGSAFPKNLDQIGHVFSWPFFGLQVPGSHSALPSLRPDTGDRFRWMKVLKVVPGCPSIILSDLNTWGNSYLFAKQIKCSNFKGII